ncbi:RDD family protein [Desulfosediminicola ganghwensis]|uniref:RDD family protein n=1 Tax=Desulfosediminicola ganghwensis TaxID=2569540 RepID=UPI0010ACBC50|nr:RDD family protein [Desulfosediminicola ganghwensis]
MNNSDIRYAPLPRRIKAGLLDTLIFLSLLIVVPAIIIDIFPDQSRYATILMLFTLFLLEPLLIRYLGSTLGQYALGVEVISTNKEKRCPLLLSVLRYVAKVTLGSFSLIFMLFSKKHQAIHDHIANTLVILSRKKIVRDPDFAAVGVYEQDDCKHIYPSAMRRFFVFIFWYALVLIIASSLINIATIVLVSNNMLAKEQYVIIYEIITRIIFFTIFLVTAILASKSSLYGARKKAVETISVSAKI